MAELGSLAPMLDLMPLSLLCDDERDMFGGITFIDKVDSMSMTGEAFNADELFNENNVSEELPFEKLYKYDSSPLLSADSVHTSESSNYATSSNTLCNEVQNIVPSYMTKLFSSSEALLDGFDQNMSNYRDAECPLWDELVFQTLESDQSSDEHDSDQYFVNSFPQDKVLRTAIEEHATESLSGTFLVGDMHDAIPSPLDDDLEGVDCPPGPKKYKKLQLFQHDHAYSQASDNDPILIERIIAPTPLPVIPAPLPPQSPIKKRRPGRPRKYPPTEPTPKGPRKAAATKRKAADSHPMELNRSSKKRNLHNESERLRRQDLTSNINAVGRLTPEKMLKLARHSILHYRKVRSAGEDSENDFCESVLNIMRSMPPQSIKSFKKDSKQWSKMETVLGLTFYQNDMINELKQSEMNCENLEKFKKLKFT